MSLGAWQRNGVALAACALFAPGCNDPPETRLAPTATALEVGKSAAPAAQTFTVDKPSSKVDFMMEAPEEKIRGRVTGASEGSLSIDPTDITKTKGIVLSDISGIELFQTKAGKNGSFGDETKSDAQNEHARAWLEISKDAPEDVRKKNERIEFAIRSIERASAQNVQAMSGAERKVRFVATGDFLLHGRKTQKTAELEATFRYEGDKPVSVVVKTTKPFGIGLAEHDVRPREAFGKLAQRTLDVLAPKVAKEALVSLELTLTPASAAPDARPPAPTGSAPPENSAPRAK